jgi:leucyl aminopeptidase
MNASDMTSALASLQQKDRPLAERGAKTGHLLVILPVGGEWHEAPDHATAEAALQRKGKKPEALAKQALALDLPGGCLSAWVRLDAKQGAFEWHSQLRQALKPLLDEHPRHIDIAVYGDEDFRGRAARAAAYVAWLNGTPLPAWKSEKAPAPLKSITLHGVSGLDLSRERARVEGSQLTRQLAWLPPNLLTPASYRKGIRSLAKAEGWAIEEYGIARLEKLKAGAFLAVSRGSPQQDAAIVHLQWDGSRKGRRGRKIALVGKGICFDTGGHNLKPARYMHNMHDDMNGSAVCLGILLAASRLKLPVKMDVWLAIAQNHISPQAYTQNEVVTALNGTSIEIVHTDAEGRMVLADALTLAVRAKPETMVDFATLTGSMAVALGDRMSGVIANRDELAATAVAAGQASGERVVVFPMPADYDEALESQVADVKQCTLEGEADHILAARFLSRFAGDQPWLHVDLSATRCKGGLGAAGSEVTGFGVGFGLDLLARLLDQ